MPETQAADNTGTVKRLIFKGADNTIETGRLIGLAWMMILSLATMAGCMIFNSGHKSHPAGAIAALVSIGALAMVSWGVASYVAGPTMNPDRRVRFGVFKAMMLIGVVVMVVMWLLANAYTNSTGGLRINGAEISRISAALYFFGCMTQLWRMRLLASERTTLDETT